MCVLLEVWLLAFCRKYIWIFNNKTSLRLYKMNPQSFKSAATKNSKLVYGTTIICVVVTEGNVSYSMRIQFLNLFRELRHPGMSELWAWSLFSIQVHRNHNYWVKQMLNTIRILLILRKPNLFTTVNFFCKPFVQEKVWTHAVQLEEPMYNKGAVEKLIWQRLTSNWV